MSSALLFSLINSVREKDERREGDSIRTRDKDNKGDLCNSQDPVANAHTYRPAHLSGEPRQP